MPPLTLFCLHFLGGSAREWRWLDRALGGAVRLVTLDLPGFGAAQAQGGRDVAAMAEHVAAAVRAASPGRWGLAGHSMGAKVALAVARRAEDGEGGLSGLDRLVLLAGSPPGPEPMEDDKRAEMLGWFAGPAARSDREAQGYVTANVGAALPPETHAQAVEDVLQAHPAAWQDWLERGSREDWTARIGVLHTPALIVAGSADAALGPDAQRAHMAPHLARHRLVTLDGAGHLLPMERPEALAELLLAHAGAAWWAQASVPGVNAGYAALLASARIATPLREALYRRGAADDPDHAPVAMDAAALAILRAVTARVVPQQGGVAIDLAARMDAALASGAGDGWRHAALPADAAAMRAGLATLDAAAGLDTAVGDGFAALDAAAQDALLRRCSDGELAVPEAALSASQLQRWFEDLRAMAVRLYVGHPATLARIGYGGIFAGGDDVRTAPGFARLGEGEAEAWEPRAQGAPA